MPRAAGNRLIVGLTLLVAAGAAFFWFAAIEATGRKDPRRINLGRQRYERDGWRILRRGRDGVATVALTVPVTCAAAYSMVIDMDMDDLPDLYVRDCDRHGYVKARAGVLAWVDLGDFDPGDAPALSSLWAREIRDGGRTFTVLAVITSALTAAGLGALAARLARGRKRQSSQ